MAKMAKYLTLCLAVILVLCSLITVESASGQTIPKPSVPQFTTTIEDHSYDVPLTSTTTINPYTGEQETHTQGGYHVENRTIDVRILNQQFTSVTMDGNTTQLYYVIRWKGHYENWNENVTYSGFDYSYYLSIGGLKASDSAYTVKSYPLTLWNIPNSKIDFQVKAQAGYSFLYSGGHILPIGNNFYAAEESDWSSIQTVTIPGNSSSVTPAPSIFPTECLPNNGPTSPPNTNSELTITLTWLIIGFLVISVISLLLYIRHLKRRKPQN